MDSEPARRTASGVIARAAARQRGAEVLDERPWLYAGVTCERCGALVEVAKFSPQHTSIQWTADAVRRCAEFAAARAAGRPSALVATCASLRASIEDAVADGRVEVLPP
jgi:hypothetical protein